ncbi:MAG TPA: hypothetical protein VGS23_02160 [Thermoplasmata archaeon]|nr:hypothetical protein [Thermoplasmata archaeon]
MGSDPRRPGRAALTFEDLLVPIAISGGLATAITAGAWSLLTKYYVPVPPNRALVLYGGRTTLPGRTPAEQTGRVELSPPRILVGGGAYVPPWRKGAGFLSLEPIDVDATVRVRPAGAHTLGPGWEAAISIQVKIPAEPGMLRAAAENLLGKSVEEIRRMVGRAVEGATPPVLIRLDVDEGPEDWERLAAELQASVARDLVVNGLAIRTLSIKELRRLPGLREDPIGEPPSYVPSVEFLSESFDPTNPFASIEASVGRFERRMAAETASASSYRAPPAAIRILPPEDPSGSPLPALEARAPATGAPELGGGRWRQLWGSKK